MNDQLLDQVLALLAKKQKLEAVKVMKAALNCSLFDAKTAVERLEAEIAAPTTDSAAEETTWQTEAKELLRQGKKLHAIKLCREQTGCSLKEAKDQMDALELRMGKHSGSGCLGVMLVAMLVLVAVWMVM